MTLAMVGGPGGVTYVSLAFSPELPPFLPQTWLSREPVLTPSDDGLVDDPPPRFVQVESNIWSINALVFLTCPIIW